MSTFVAVDIGGTHIRAAAYKPDNISPLTHKRTRSYANKPGTFNRLVDVIESAWPTDHTVIAIGMASPGPLDPKTGVVFATPNIPEWQNFPLTEKLSQHFGVPAHLDNDANLAALGEWKFGAGCGHHDLLYLTISTGIGGGVSQSGPLLFEPFENSLRTHVFNPHYLENLVITTAALGDDAGLLGALALAQMASE